MLPHIEHETWRDPALDDLDRQVVAALQINGRASWRDIAGAVGANESTVMRRGRRLIEGGLLRVVGYIDVLRAGIGVPALVRISCDPASRTEIQSVIRQRPDVRHAAAVTGPTDIVAEFVVPTPSALARVLSQELPGIHGVRGTETLPVMHTYYSRAPWQPGALSKESTLELAQGAADLTAERQWESPVLLDTVDHAIMAALADDGRRSAKAIASEISISESTVARRIERLVAEGCVFFRIVAPPAMLGFNTELVIWLRVNSSELDATAKFLLTHTAIKYMWVTSGRFNLCLGVHLRHLGELYTFETETLGSLTSVADLEINNHLTTLKRAWIPLEASMPRNSTAATEAVRALIIASDYEG